MAQITDETKPFTIKLKAPPALVIPKWLVALASVGVGFGLVALSTRK